MSYYFKFHLFEVKKSAQKLSKYCLPVITKKVQLVKFSKNHEFCELASATNSFIKKILMEA